MKKKLVVGLVVLFCFLLTACGEEEVVEVKKEVLTLDKMAELISNTNAYPNVKCSDMNEFKVIDSTSDKILLSNGKIYSLLLEDGKLYSNNEQCMSSVKTQFSKIVNNSYLVGTNKKMYSMYDFKVSEYADNINDSKYKEWYEDTFTEEEQKKYDKLSGSKQEKGSYVSYSYRKYMILKNDGNIYSTIYRIRNAYNSGKSYKVVKESIAYSSYDYGFITDFNLYSYGNSKTVDMIVSNRGIYTLKEIVTDECAKYEDVICEQKLSLIEDFSYEKYKDQIKYVDKNFVITNNGSFLKTKLVFNIDNARNSYSRIFEDYEQ